jgi:hypothetical protein
VLIQVLVKEETLSVQLWNKLTEQGLYGQVTVESGSYDRLFYADEIANLVIVEDLKESLEAGISLREVSRVVSPGGIILLGERSSGELTGAELEGFLSEAGIGSYQILEEKGLWAKILKEVLAGRDEWREYCHSGDRNAVSGDKTLALPDYTRWLAGPAWPRGHRKASTLGAVSANGRNFYCTVNSASNLYVPRVPAGDRRRWFLVARDAYNGLFLWERPWEYGGTYQGPYTYDIRHLP